MRHKCTQSKYDPTSTTTTVLQDNRLQMSYANTMNSQEMKWRHFGRSR